MSVLILSKYLFYGIESNFYLSNNWGVSMRYLIVLMIIIAHISFANGYICAVGGGAEINGGWSDKPYKWIVEKSNYGKIVILSIDDTNTWLVDYFKSFGANEVVNLNVSNKTQANDNNIYNIINSAKAIFIKGGDQYDYISYWKGTLVEIAIKNVFNNGGVVAGTSAGAMILGEYFFTARYGSTYPDECIANPFNSYANIDKNFLNFVSNTIFDTHVSERGRILRLIPFVFKIRVNFNSNVLGIGVDDQTALCIDKNGIGYVYGSGAVHFVQFDGQSTYYNSSNQYNLENIKVDMLTEGWAFNLNTRQVEIIPSSAKSVNQSNKKVNIKANCIVSGSNDFKQNYIALSKYLETNFTKIAILYNTGSNIDYLKSYLTNRNKNYEAIEIKSTSLNDITLASKLQQCDGIIFYGSSLSILYTLADTSYLLSKEVFKKFNKSTTNLLFIGNTSKMIGNSYYDNYDNSPTASLYGKMVNKKGFGIVENLSVIPRIFESRDYYENRVNALLYAIMHNNDLVGLYLDTNYCYMIKDNVVKSLNDKPIISINTKYVTYFDSSKYLFSSSVAPRQVIAATNLRFNISNIKKDYLLNDNVINIEEDMFVDKNSKIYDIDVLAYPNPFNPTINLKFIIPYDDFYHIELYDITGRKIKDITNEKFFKGVNIKSVDLSSNSSGIYVVAVKNSKLKKCIKINLQK